MLEFDRDKGLKIPKLLQTSHVHGPEEKEGITRMRGEDEWGSAKERVGVHGLVGWLVGDPRLTTYLT